VVEGDEITYGELQRAYRQTEAAYRQGKFWEMHDKIFENTRALEDTNLKQHAVDLELDVDAFNACYESGQFRNAVQADFRSGNALGVTGTPAFFVNGRFLSGAQPFEAFKAIIDDELSRAGG